MVLHCIYIFISSLIHFQTIKVEFFILVAKNDAFDEFQKNFFFEEKSFMLNHSDKWLENILKFYQDYGLQPFQSIKVSQGFGILGFPN